MIYRTTMFGSKLKTTIAKWRLQVSSSGYQDDNSADDTDHLARDMGAQLQF